MKSRLFSLLFLAVLTACDLGAGELDVQFAHTLLPSAEGAEESATVQGSNGAVYGAGIIKAPNTCQKLIADVQVSGAALTITIAASNLRPDCPGGVGAYTYQLTVADLDARRYDVKVVYDFSGQRPTIIALQEELTIR